MKHFLDTKGLSMTQAQTVSNLCNQAANEMLVSIERVNNAGKTLDFNGKPLTKQEARALPATIEDQLNLIGDYRACQAFIMEQIKAKDALLSAAKNADFFPKAVSPKYPELSQIDQVKRVDDQWGWDQLSKDEMAEYWQTEAKAATIGQFIHKGGKLDQLRKELPKIEPLEWFVAPGHEGKAIPVRVVIHHDEMQLWDLHQHLANLHRELEQRVNYFKAKVKNLVTLRNAEISKENAEKIAEVSTANDKLMDAYTKELAKYRDEVKAEHSKFEGEKLDTIKQVSALRIQIDARFQPIVDELLGKDKED